MRAGLGAPLVWLLLDAIAPVLSRSVALVSKACDLLSAIVWKPKLFYKRGSDGMVSE
jgi:hypothetical protein